MGWSAGKVGSQHGVVKSHGRTGAVRLGADQFSFFMAMVGVMVVLRRAIVLSNIHVVVRMIAMAVRMVGGHDHLDLR